MLALLAGACTNSPDSHYFTLAPVPPQDRAREGRPALRILTFYLPQLYDRSQMVFRTGMQSVDIDETDRWAEPLDRLAARILAEDLAQRRPNPSGNDIMLRVTIDDFIVDRSGAAHLSGHWNAGSRSGVFDWTAETGGAGADQAAAALSILLGRLADEVNRVD